MERFVCGLGIELDVEAFVKCCRGNMDWSEDGASVPSLGVQQMGVEDEEEDGAEYVEYTEAPEFYVVDAECYYGEVNMEAATDDPNPWADMVDETPIPDAVHDRSSQVALREARGRVLRKMCDGWGECLACSLKSKKTRYGNGVDHFLTDGHGEAEKCGYRGNVMKISFCLRHRLRLRLRLRRRLRLRVRLRLQLHLCAMWMMVAAKICALSYGRKVSCQTMFR